MDRTSTVAANQGAPTTAGDTATPPADGSTRRGPRKISRPDDLAAAIKELKAGRIEFRADKTGVVHLPVGKVSMEPAKVNENVQTFMAELERRRPADLKGEFIKSVAVSSTMGPGVRIQFKVPKEKE
jgi:ribosomal protein L1